MNPLFKKLNYESQSFSPVVKAQVSFLQFAKDREPMAKIATHIENVIKTTFALVFVRRQEEIIRFAFIVPTHQAKISTTKKGISK